MAFIVNYNTMQTINKYKTASDACFEVAKRLAELAKTGGNVALSGGETPKLLFLGYRRGQNNSLQLSL